MGYIGSGPTRFNTADDLTVTGDAEVTGAITTDGMTTTGNVSFGDNDKAVFGDKVGGDLVIYHNASDSYITDLGTGNLRIGATNLKITNAADTEVYIDAFENGAVNLRYDNGQKLATTSTGVDVTGTVTATAFSGDGSSLTGIPTPTLTSLGIANHDDITVDGSGNVGIGTSPSVPLHIYNATTNGVARFESGDATTLVQFKDSGTTLVPPSIGAVSNDLVMQTNNTEAARIDSSQNLLVGKTSVANGLTTQGFDFINNNYMTATNDGNIVARFSRLTSDGGILQFYRGSTLVGSIASRGGLGLTVDSAGANGRLGYGGTAYYEWNTTRFAPVTDTVGDLGRSANRFKDLYLSGTVTAGDMTLNGTGAITLPSGTTAQRPSSPVAGMIRYNTTESANEVYNGTSWVPIDTIGYPYTINYLVVAGGGAGGANHGGGGGAGGYIYTASASVDGLTEYAVTVGAGGAGVQGTGNSGSNSVFKTTTAIGGGGGGGNQAAGVDGGSGGGSSRGASAGYGTSGQGSNGGTGGTYSGGGGGGASAGGSNGATYTGGNGGAGTSSSISGASVTYAGGGGGNGYTAAGGTGGAGGGGDGGQYSGAAYEGTNGAANTGGGGGGNYVSAGRREGMNGGSGVVIISYAGSQRGTGGTVTSSGGNTIHTFTSSGTFTA
jgi:hypothetical protein